MRNHELRKMTFKDMRADVPILELPVVIEGSVEDCRKKAESLGCVWKPSPKYVMGGYYYNKQEMVCYLIT